MQGTWWSMRTLCGLLFFLEMLNSVLVSLLCTQRVYFMNESFLSMSVAYAECNVGVQLVNAGVQ